MKFGTVDNPGEIDFSLPADHPDTKRVLKAHKNKQPFEIYVGCAKWNRQDLKGFYPRGTKDELSYYASQFNSIELNATFYNSPDRAQVETWKSKTPENFRFFPKIPNTISHFKRLINVQEPVEAFCDAISNFEEKLGMSFLQMHDNFKPKDIERLVTFVKNYPPAIPLAVEMRNTEWFTDRDAAEQFYQLLEGQGKTNIIVDTAGRRDMLHMRLTSPTAFIRYVGANHSTDYSRLDSWLERIKDWRSAGLQTLYFFVHQNVEKESPLLSAYFIKKLNETFSAGLKVPESAG
ncbi:uncharacterized protein YecE (DUF72 family) [Anseongella ginsenosidimutans]|uniref:Uncharacterized protein YecE (DUF72 family) n=1 Tax=Anseongella ginsenosidimutans TaxID=496056 RepID=A0A4V2UTV3_9SPHI|nr:DUF72 domain-containing protein [Anseongella ginsenosidimutans]QEC53145.1 DUF72 domain-containing protein [Anseongella ginsenosidimutans]TCS87768.1 uncharacterized protein YecE (DUF72 family) [Anseongella ginsenosidimutans]